MIQLLIFLLVLAVVGVPLILSIVALIYAAKARGEVREMRARLGGVAAPTSQPIQKVSTPAAKIGPPEVPMARNVPEKVPDGAPKGGDRSGMELVLGGKVASFVGIAVLLIGIAFLVGYAIRNAWLGPGARVLIGLLSGGGLVVLGHICEVRGARKLRALARALTGGGAALFYFVVFSAYGIYHLIPAWLCGAGLLLSALAVMGLALVYSSQAVALIGVLGAFITPLLIGGDFEKGIFPLVYIAVLNLPVMLLGVRRNWQWLYNIAFGMTVVFVMVWIDWFRDDNWVAGILFTSVYFLQFAGLGLLKLRGERHRTGRAVDLVRLCLNSLLYLGALYWLFEKSDYAAWTAAAFLLVAALHIAIARAAWRWLPCFTQDTLAFLIGGLTFASLALPIQLDGAWVSVGWGIEGLVLCWLALRVRSRHLQEIAVLLGVVGLFKTLWVDIDLYAVEPTIFLNARFGSGMLCGLLLGAQAWLSARSAPTAPAPAPAAGGLVWLTIGGVLAVIFADAFWSLGGDQALAWVLTSAALLAVAVCVSLFASASRMFRWPAIVLLAVFPLKIMLDLMVIPSLDWWGAGDFFFNPLFGVQILGVLAAAVWLALGPPRRIYAEAGGARIAAATGLLAIAAIIAVVSSEFLRLDSDWSSTAVTIWWALAAISLVMVGLIRSIRRYRYAGLLLFSAVLVKVFFFDLSQLRDLERIAAFIGAGILLLLLSYLYQRMSAKFGSFPESVGRE